MTERATEPVAGHLLVESGGPAAGPGCARFVGDAARLAEGGRRVVLFLVENGVAAALPGAVPALDELLRAGGEVWVDAFSASQRALPAADLVPACREAGMDDVAAELLRPGVQAVWH